MTPLSAFWHRTRRQYVPLTAEEWDAKARIGTGDRIKLTKAGFVTGRQESFPGPLTYEITPAGIEAHRASIVRATA